MSVRDIIRDAQDNIDGVLGEDWWFTAEELPYGHDEVSWRRCDRFIEVMSPEHVALMERFIEAAQSAALAQQSYRYLEPDEYDCFVAEFYAASEALTAYRRESGLL